MRTRRLDRRTCALCALAVMVALLTTRFSGRESDVTDLPPRTPGAAPLLFGRSIGHGGRIEFERAHRGALPRLVIISGRTFDESTITDAMGLFDRALDTRAPFTVMWDPRLLRFPRVSPRQLRLVHGWVRDNVVRWDTQAQARHYRSPNRPSPIVQPAHQSSESRCVFSAGACDHHHQPARPAARPAMLPIIRTAAAVAYRERRGRRARIRTHVLRESSFVGQRLVRRSRLAVLIPAVTPEPILFWL